jgi:hypothetical protein
LSRILRAIVSFGSVALGVGGSGFGETSARESREHVKSHTVIASAGCNLTQGL